MSRILDTFFHRQTLRRWRRAQREVDRVGPGELRAMRARARELRQRLDRLLFAAEERLAVASGPDTIEKPLHTDWAYRPEAWRGALAPPGLTCVGPDTRLGTELKVFHDCEVSELALRQVRNGAAGGAPFGLCLDVYHFDGSFLSLVVDFPEAAGSGLERRHIVRLAMRVEVEQPMEIFARLNIKNGPNIEQIVKELSVSGVDDVAAEFDLAYTKMNERRVEQMWLDLIFEGAAMNRIVLRDLVVTRRPRLDI